MTTVKFAPSCCATLFEASIAKPRYESRTHEFACLPWFQDRTAVVPISSAALVVPRSKRSAHTSSQCPSPLVNGRSILLLRSKFRVVRSPCWSRREPDDVEKNSRSRQRRRSHLTSRESSNAHAGRRCQQSTISGVLRSSRTLLKLSIMTLDSLV